MNLTSLAKTDRSNFRILRPFGFVTSIFIFLVGSQTAFADDFLWQPADSNDGLWSNPANWENAAAVFSGTGTTSVTSPPSAINDIAIVGYSNTPNITLTANYNIASIGVGGSGPEPTLGTSYGTSFN